MADLKPPTPEEMTAVLRIYASAPDVPRDPLDVAHTLAPPGQIQRAVEAQVQAAKAGYLYESFPAAGNSPSLFRITASGLDRLSALDEILTQLEAAREGATPRGIPTGLIDLTMLLGGGWKQKQLVIPASRPGVGKSMLSLGFAKTAARQGHRTVVFSTEMNRTELAIRLLSDVAEVPLHLIDSPKRTPAEARRLSEARQAIGRWPLHVFDMYVSLTQIQAVSRRIAQHHGGVDLIVVDYLQRLEVDRRQERRDLEVAEIAWSLKCLAMELDTTVIAVSQLSRGPEYRADRRPQLSDLRESGALEQEADIVILLHRDDYYDRESPRAGEADLIVAKHRNGPTDTITVAAQLHYARFVDMAFLPD